MTEGYHQLSRSESLLLEEIKAIRSDLKEAEEKRDAVIENGAYLARSIQSLTDRVDEFADRDQKDHDRMTSAIGTLGGDMRLKDDTMKALIVGDKDTIGLVTRIDRLEQSQIAERKAREWIGRVVAALAASGVTAVVVWIIKH
jgi:hypothetical protein